MIAPLLFAIAVAGDWTGTSLCTNLKALPACHDETVLYHFKELSETKVHVVADKIVNGKAETMGEFDMARDGSRLTYEMVDGQKRRSLWDFHVDSDRITGTLKLLPGGEIVRKIDVRRTR
jgi:hypothetical protein